MCRQKVPLAAGVAIILTVVASVPSWSAAALVQFQFQILHAFPYPSMSDGNGPQGGLVLDPEGNLYGVTNSGGTDNFGVVFELTPGAGGQWTETIIHSFSSGPMDGANPVGVAIDGSGNLFGMTEYGGSNTYKGIKGCGTVFELTPGANGEWTESILWNFCSLPNCADGGVPLFGPTIDPTGGVFGVTAQGAFELTPGLNGWTFTLLSKLGPAPTGGLTLDVKGNLYEESHGGMKGGGCGNFGCGKVFALHPLPDGRWKQINLYDFVGGYDGTSPSGGVTLRDDALYGTTEAGGGNYCFGGCGTVFQLTRGVGNSVNEQIIHSFGENLTPGVLPLGGVIFDAQGDLFGVTAEGGQDGFGIVYGMKPQGMGKWGFTMLHSFVGSDGVEPDAGLAINAGGNLYGEAAGGGPGGGGVIFELLPVAQAPK